MNEITHYELCKTTAEWQLPKSRIVLYEYQSYATGEFPDVLCFKNGYSRLYEIKVGRQDFLKDPVKDCRVEVDIKYFPRLTWKHNKIQKIDWNKWKPEIKEFIKEHPHLGRQRYYVCPTGLIKPEEVRNGWGLYWFDGLKFRMKKESKNFKCNIYAELSIMEHAFRKYASTSGKCNVLINTYEEK